ncbi:hypothetical protein EI290_15460 [Hymenobacter metallilatus]|uniref:Uncharacterized protein n=1 Tax=Hymenobacter metallilatus TaxID=2493666 RepID=A0A428JDA9_9BACT|nr:hypothetical protein EI290_15460 [Hymenobacter metallilatus]
MGKRSVKQLVFFTAFGVFVYFLQYVGKEGDIEACVKNIRGEYKGVIIEKYRRKIDYIKIRTEDSIIDIPLLSIALKDNAQVGDSIKKIALKNECILTKNGQVMHMEYVFISESIRNDSRWPRDLSHIVASDE